MVCWSIGTLAFSILLVTYEVVPLFIGCLGIVASISIGFVDGIRLVKPNISIVWSFGGLVVLIFELILGGWLVGLGLMS